MLDFVYSRDHSTYTVIAFNVLTNEKFNENYFNFLFNYLLKVISKSFYFHKSKENCVILDFGYIRDRRTYMGMTFNVVTLA